MKMANTIRNAANNTTNQENKTLFKINRRRRGYPELNEGRYVVTLLALPVIKEDKVGNEYLEIQVRLNNEAVVRTHRVFGEISINSFHRQLDKKYGYDIPVTVGANGNWFISDMDTGEVAEGLPEGSTGFLRPTDEELWTLALNKEIDMWLTTKDQYKNWNFYEPKVTEEKIMDNDGELTDDIAT